MKNRLGKFYIADFIIKNNLEEVAEILSQLKFVPVKVENLFHMDKIEYIGYSPLFREIEKNSVWPEYQIIITKNEDDTISVKAEEIK